MKIAIVESKVYVTADYNSAFVAQARNLGGKWANPSWVFDARDEVAVRAACLECYGSDGLTADLVDVRITIPEDCRAVGGGQGPIELFGRTLARAFGRDSGAKLGEGVVIEQGGFSSGGSMKNWCTTVKDNTVLILRDVSAALVAKHDNEAFLVEVIAHQNQINRDELNAEREKLIARLAETDALLAAE